MNINKKIIIGAGLAGLTAANYDKDTTTSVIYDKNSVAGGLCINWFAKPEAFTKKYLEKFKALSFNPCRYGDHIFHTNDEFIYNLFNELYDTERFEARTVTLSDDVLYCWPVNRDTLLAFGFDDTIIADLKSKYPNGSTFNIFKQYSNDQSFKDKCDRLYNTLIYPYSKKQWGDHAFEKTLESRVKIFYDSYDLTFRDRYQCVPLKMDYSKTKLLDHPNIKFAFNSEVNIDSFDNEIFANEESPVLIINTGPIDAFYKCEKRLPYRTCDFIYGYDHEKRYNNLPMIINIPDAEYPYTRLHKSGSILTYEIPRYVTDNTDVPMYPFEDIIVEEHLQEIYPHNTLRVFPLPDGSNAYVDIDSVNNAVILHVGRLATYTYLNMDSTLLHVLCAMNSIKSMNSIQEYCYRLDTLQDYASRYSERMFKVNDKFSIYRANPKEYVLLLSNPDTKEQDTQLIYDLLSYYESFVNLTVDNSLVDVLLPIVYVASDADGNINVGFNNFENYTNILTDKNNDSADVIDVLDKVYLTYIDNIDSDISIELPETFSKYTQLKKAKFRHGDLRLENIFYRRISDTEIAVQLRWPKGTSCIGSILDDLIMFYKSCVQYKCEILAERFVGTICKHLGIEDDVLEDIKNEALK